MSEQTFAQKTLDKLLKVIEVELKLPLGIAEVKFSPTEIAKEWREDQKKRSALENAIQRAEEKFIADHEDQNVAQILHQFPLHSETEYQEVIAELLTHLSEEKITWLAEINLQETWGNIVSTEEVRQALALYIPYLRHELNSVEEFREVISALRLERIEKSQIRIESKLDEFLDSDGINKDKQDPDFWFIPHPYPMPPNFTGRVKELEMLDHWLEDSSDRLFILRALGGFGKSALSWYWLTQRVDESEWPKLVWWSFYEGDAHFENFVKSTLEYLERKIPEGQRAQVYELVNALRSRKTLLILDGFERTLRAYGRMNAAYQGDEMDSLSEEGANRDNRSDRDCININAEIFLKNICLQPGMKSKILMSTRLAPRAIEQRGEFIQGCREVELKEMHKNDAITFFRKEGISHASDYEIENVCKTYGYHPLCLRLLAGRIMKDFGNPGDISIAQKLRIDGDLKQHQHHILEVAFDGLLSPEQKLISTIACFRFMIDFETLAALTENRVALERNLYDLIERGLLQFDRRNKRFDMHPIVRRYVYERLTSQARDAEHTRLSDFFAAVETPTNVRTVDDLRPIIELFHHTVSRQQYTSAIKLYRDQLAQLLYDRFSEYEREIELLSTMFLNGNINNPHIQSQEIVIWVLNALGTSYSRSGQSQLAIPALEKANEMDRMRPDKEGYAIGLGNLAQDQMLVGSLKKAYSALKQKIEICKSSYAYQDQNAIAHRELGRLWIYLGNWYEAQIELSLSLSYFRKTGSLAGQLSTQLCFALRSLLMIRGSYTNDEKAFNIDSVTLAISDLINLKAKISFLAEHDVVWIHWLLGTSLGIDGRFVESEKYLSLSLARCRIINLVEIEANILLELARIHYKQQNYNEAKSLAVNALTITERCGYALQGADVNLFLAQSTLEQERNRVQAKEYARTALKLATCDGPPYFYRVAYEEAEKMLERLK
jgi:tetratricopeptide (TPR) repeat protein